MKLLGRADLGPTRSDLEKLLQDGRHGQKDGLENALKKILEEDLRRFRRSWNHRVIHDHTTGSSIAWQNELKLYQLSGLC